MLRPHDLAPAGVWQTFLQGGMDAMWDNVLYLLPAFITIRFAAREPHFAALGQAHEADLGSN